MPSSKLQKAAIGSEDAIPCARLWLGMGDGCGSGGSCFPGHPPSQEQRSDRRAQRGCCNPPHKGLAPGQNVLLPCKFCCFRWFKTGLQRYFNIVFCSFNAVWVFFFFFKCWWIYKRINLFFFWFPKTPYFFIASAVNYVIKIREIKWSQKEGKGQQE